MGGGSGRPVVVLAPPAAAVADGLAGALTARGWCVTLLRTDARPHAPSRTAWPPATPLVAVVEDDDGMLVPAGALAQIHPAVALGTVRSAELLARLARRGTLVVSRSAAFEVVTAATVDALSERPTLTGPTPEAIRTRADEARRLDRLTAAERATLGLLLHGCVAAEIAAGTHVSLHTVRSHVKSLLAKLEVRSQVAAVALARRCSVRAGPDGGSSGSPQLW